MTEPPASGLTSRCRTISGLGPVSRTLDCDPSLMPPTGSCTDRAIPGALIAIRRSAWPMLTRPRKRPAFWPRCRTAPTGGPSTNRLLIVMLSPVPAEATVPSVGWCHCRVGALFPASHPAMTGTSATAAAIRMRRGTTPQRLLRITEPPPACRVASGQTSHSVAARIALLAAGPPGSRCYVTRAAKSLLRTPSAVAAVAAACDPDRSPGSTGARPSCRHGHRQARSSGPAAARST